MGKNCGIAIKTGEVVTGTVTAKPRVAWDSRCFCNGTFLASSQIDVKPFY